MAHDHNYNILKRRVSDLILTNSFNFDQKLQYFFSKSPMLSLHSYLMQLIFLFKITYLIYIFLQFFCFLLLQKLYFHLNSIMLYLFQFSLPFYLILLFHFYATGAFGLHKWALRTFFSFIFFLKTVNFF